MTGSELSKWADNFMFTAEESKASEGVKAFLLGAPNDPLGHIAACAKMYKGEVVRDLRDVTDAERQEYLTQVQRTILGMPLEAVQLHFMIEGVTRSLTHQAVRQRTAAYAQESMRFAVKEDMASAVAYPPSLDGTMSLAELVQDDLRTRQEIGLQMAKPSDAHYDEWMDNLREGLRHKALNGGFGDAQKWRIRWDDGLAQNAQMYLDLVNDGMPAEDARGSAWHNVTTRYNYITNLRNFYTEMSKRLSDQAQFEWRSVVAALAVAMREYGARTTYQVWVTEDELDQDAFEDGGEDYTLIRTEPTVGSSNTMFLIERSAEWQYVALSNEMKPVDFALGRRAFDANFDRPSRYGERIDTFVKYGVPSSQWTVGSVEHGIPPIHPDEWLLDPNAARLADGMEFDIFGNRVPEGTGWHYVDHGVLGRFIDGKPVAGRWPRDFVDEMYHEENKPGQDDADVEEIIAELDEDLYDPRPNDEATR